MQTPTTVPPEEAAQTLDSVRAAREATDHRLASNGFPLFVGAAALFVSSFLIGVWDGAAVALYWLVATPVLLYALKRDERLQLRLSGAVRNRRTWIIYAGSFVASCVVCGIAAAATGEPDVVNHGPVFGVAAVHAAIALRDRKAGLAFWALVLAALAGVGILTGGDGLAGTFAVVVGGVLVLEGFAERRSRGT